jgi:hypothetical protein
MLAGAKAALVSERDATERVAVQGPRNSELWHQNRMCEWRTAQRIVYHLKGVCGGHSLGRGIGCEGKRRMECITVEQEIQVKARPSGADLGQTER